jgi:hypothetical protein
MADESIFLTPTGFISEINCGTSTPKFGGNINISHYQNLTGFTCESNDIENISDISQNKNLKLFNVSNNKLTGLVHDFALNTGITIYKINDNQFSGNLLNLSNAKDLRIYDASNNFIEGSVPELSANTKLEYFNLSGNKLTGFNSTAVSPTIGTFNLNNNLLTSSAVDSILTEFVDANRNIGSGICILDLSGSNEPPTVSDGNGSFFQSADLLWERQNNVVTAFCPNEFVSGDIVTFSNIKGPSSLNGTYEIIASDGVLLQYKTTEIANATGSGLALIRSTTNNSDGFKKYQILSLPTGQGTVPQKGRGFDVKINFDIPTAIKMNNTIVINNNGFPPSLSTNSNGDRVIIGLTDLFWVNSDTPDVTFTDAGDLVNLTSHGLYNGDTIRFLSIESTTGIEVDTIYFVINTTEDTFQVSADYDGVPLTLTTNGTGVLSYDMMEFNGAAEVYEWNGNDWDQIGNTILAEGFQVNEEFGYSVSMNDIGDIVAVGARSYDADLLDQDYSDRGLVRIYQWKPAVDGFGNPVGPYDWYQIGQDIIGRSEYSLLGTSISLNAVGDKIAISSARKDYMTSDDDVGEVDVYHYNGSEWIQLAEPIVTERSFISIEPEVSMNSDGNRLAIGYLFADTNNGASSGCVRVFYLNDTVWTQLGNDIIGEAPGDWSGENIALNAEGNRVVVGAAYNDGNSGDPEDDRGHARVYEWDGNEWIQMGQDIDGDIIGALQGMSVSIDDKGDRIVIGQPYAGGVNDSGSVKIYEFNYEKRQWIKLVPDIGFSEEEYAGGSSVTLSSLGNRFFASSQAGSIRAYQLPSYIN